MYNKCMFVFIPLAFSIGLHAAESMTSIPSHHSALDTANRFEAIINKKGLTLFARINHQGNADGVGLKLRPTEVFVFGNPKVGTPLMQCSQAVAIDLPQKVLVREDEQGKVWISYNNPEYLKERHDIQGCDSVITKISKVLADLSRAAASE